MILGSSVGISLFISILLFVFWFFTGYYYIFVILFGLAMGSLISATLLFTPLGMYMYVGLLYKCYDMYIVWVDKVKSLYETYMP